MGGMISRLMITDSADTLWLRTFGKPPEQVPLSAKSREIVTESLIVRHRPEVVRVIFIAAPHRGSDLARKLARPDRLQPGARAEHADESRKGSAEPRDA
jgi:hypothetical protein